MGAVKPSGHEANMRVLPDFRPKSKRVLAAIPTPQPFEANNASLKLTSLVTVSTSVESAHCASVASSL
jgi:hypothetical protein